MAASRESNQIVRRSMFQNFFYSMTKNFFDEVNIEINGNRPGNDFFVVGRKV